MIYRYSIVAFTCMHFFITPIHAQKTVDSLEICKFSAYIRPAPESIFSAFRKAGMNPVNHVLADIEIEKVEKAFSTLPISYQKILKEHLHSISFMDNMPNTALTSPVETNDPVKKFNIVIRAEILNETISQWATWRENTYFVHLGNDGYQVCIDAGSLDAIIYVLLHESTHVVDAVLEITPHPEERDALVAPTAITKDVWHTMNVPAEKYIRPVLEKTRFRSGRPMYMADAKGAYEELEKTPFVSFYGMASWFEDFAELATIYHLVEKLDQPFRISIKREGREISSFEPLQNKLVKQRLNNLEKFYE